MKKILDISQALLSFDRTPITEGERTVILKDVLLNYLSRAGDMVLSQSEKGIAYAVGMMIGTSEKEVSFSPEQYDLLKKICDNPTIRVQTEKGLVERPLSFSIIITQQVKEMVDAAETVKEEPKKK